MQQYIIYKENGVFKGTPISNYVQPIRNASLIRTFRGFESLKDCIDYCLRYAIVQRCNLIAIPEGCELYRVEVCLTIKNIHYIAADSKDTAEDIVTDINDPTEGEITDVSFNTMTADEIAAKILIKQGD